MKYVCLFVVLWWGPAGWPAQSGYQPAPENLRSREAFQDSRFGMFIHWGIYSMLGDGEWAMTNKNIDCREYAKLAGGFYPSKFDVKAWVQAAKDAGMKYICITSRHHDGFSMFGTRYSDYNIVEATPYGRTLSGNWRKSAANRGSGCISIIHCSTGRAKITIRWALRGRVPGVRLTGIGTITSVS